MGKSTPQAPAAPDYAAAATAQGAANQAGAQQTATLSNPNIISPYGNQTVTYGKTAPVVDQAGYDQAMKNFNSTQDTYDQYGNLQSKGASPTIDQFTTQGDLQPTVTQTLTPDAQAALTAQQKVQAGTANLGLLGLQQATGVLNQPFNYTGPGIQTSLGQQSPLNYGPAPGQYGQASGINASQYGNLQTSPDMSGVAKMPVNAGMTGQQAIMSRLQPQIDQQSAATAQQLANQGITPGSEAYNNAMRTQGQQQNDLYTQAALQGIGLDTSANQQGYNQALSSAGLYNQALGQGYTQQLGAQQLGNQAIGQNYGQGATSAGLYNQAGAQGFNQNLGAAQFGNTAAAQSMQQQLGLYNQPLNSINALMSSSQIQNPQFQQYTGANVAAAPVFQGVQAQAQAAQDIYGQQMAAKNAQTAAIGNIIGSAAGLAAAPMAGGGSLAGNFFKSDIRLKSNIVRVGSHSLGIGIYEYDIDSHRERGVIAQEVLGVKPEAVAQRPDGYLMVNYGAL